MQILLGDIENFLEISVNWEPILRQFSESKNHCKGELPVIYSAFLHTIELWELTKNFTFRQTKKEWNKVTKVCNIDRNIYDAVVSKSKYSQLRSPRQYHNVFKLW